MHTRLLSMSGVAALISVALVLPAQAAAESFPNKAGNYVSNHTEYFVAALVVAILILLLVVSITQRRNKAKAAKQKSPASPRFPPRSPLPRWRRHPPLRPPPPPPRARSKKGRWPANSSARLACNSDNNARRRQNAARKSGSPDAPANPSRPLPNSHKRRFPYPTPRLPPQRPSPRPQSLLARACLASAMPKSGAGARRRQRLSEN